MIEEAKLPLVEIFPSIQGEGYYSGMPATFIRIAGCDVGCSWCDTVDSWNADDYPLFSIDEIVKRVKSFTILTVVITGGEPLLYNMDNLTGKLYENEYQVHVETSGVYPLSGTWNWISLSPKVHKPPRVEMFKLANEVKVIIQTREDFKWAEGVRRQVSKHCKLFLQPEWSKRQVITPEIYKYILQNPWWNVSLQIHKFMDIP